jgi:exonuclease III
MLMILLNRLPATGADLTSRERHFTQGFYGMRFDYWGVSDLLPARLKMTQINAAGPRQH